MLIFVNITSLAVRMNTEIRNDNSEVSYKKTRSLFGEYTKEFRHKYVSEATSPGIESKNRHTNFHSDYHQGRFRLTDSQTHH